MLAVVSETKKGQAYVDHPKVDLLDLLIESNKLRVFIDLFNQAFN